jgi:DNA-binding transcriptional regulator GbsR (MarR family)
VPKIKLSSRSESEQNNYHETLLQNKKPHSVSSQLSYATSLPQITNPKQSQRSFDERIEENRRKLQQLQSITQPYAIDDYKLKLTFDEPPKEIDGFATEHDSIDYKKAIW